MSKQAPPDDFDQLFRDHREAVFRAALRVTGQAADAEDVLQRTFLQAIEVRGRFEAGRPVRPWLTGLLANQARLVRRERARRASPSSDPAAEPDPRDAAAAAELREVVERAKHELDRLFEAVHFIQRQHEKLPTIGLVRH